MTLPAAREVLARASGHPKKWFRGGRVRQVRAAIAEVLRRRDVTEDDRALAWSVDMSMHGEGALSRAVLMGG
jgi:hypothetical protein